MAKKPADAQVHRDFEYADDRTLDALIAAFREQHEREHGERLAMHARRELGRGKVRITFRVVEAAKRR
ncbi:MAG: hypothetical protein U0168_03150 [Nannocystaceae bacterium]|jgi:hypothetical protein